MCGEWEWEVDNDKVIREKRREQAEQTGVAKSYHLHESREQIVGFFFHKHTPIIPSYMYAYTTWRLMQSKETSWVLEMTCENWFTH